MIARQFLEAGLGGSDDVEEAEEAGDDVSNSSSDERTQSASPHHQNKNINNNGKNEIGTREESPDSESHKVPKLQKLNPSSSNSIDQSTTATTTEAAMRKARVSVRARSEAPMVNIN